MGTHLPPVSPEVSKLIDSLTGEYPGLELEPLFTKGSPQNCAINWLALEDGWTVGATADNVRIQRIAGMYALAVIFFAAIGRDCIEVASSFPNVDFVCNLGLPDDLTQIGRLDLFLLSCDDEGFIVELSLGAYHTSKKRLDPIDVSFYVYYTSSLNFFL